MDSAAIGAAAADAASPADNAMRAWSKGARVMQPTYGSGTLVEVNEHHTGIACDEHGHSKQHEDRHQLGRSCRALTQETTRSEAIRFWRSTAESVTSPDVAGTAYLELALNPADPAVENPLTDVPHRVLEFESND
jgi:hypothetical protein